MVTPPSAPDDPRRVRPGESRQRDHLANQRTLLAWLRLTVGLFAFGFVVARFGLFLEELGMVSPLHTRLSGQHSMILGLAFVLSGIVLTIMAFRHYLVVERDIEQGLVQPHHGLVYTVVALALAAGLLLLIYLGIAWPSPSAV